MGEKVATKGHVLHMKNVIRPEPNARKYRTSIIRAAEELGYGKSVIASLRAAKTMGEMSDIMRNARLSAMEDERRTSNVKRIFKRA